MAQIDIFADEAFNAVHLTKIINDVPRVPSKIGDRKLFTEESITTTQIWIEKDAQGLHLVPARARGAPGEPVTFAPGSRIPFQAVHLPQRGSVMADEVQNVRSFGMQNSPTQEVASVTALVTKKLAKMRQQGDLTLEWQRVGVLKGKIYDWDGVTVLLDIFAAFNKTQQTIDFELDDTATDVRAKCMATRRLIESKLGGLGYSGIRALVSPSFMDALVKHASVKAAYAFPGSDGFLRSDPSAAGTFSFGGINWEEYSGSIVLPNQASNSVPTLDFIEDGYAYIYPEGVSDLFITAFAPADYNETVNTPGLPFYAKQERMRFDKGVELEAQSNPLSLCSRPEVIIKAVKF